MPGGENLNPYVAPREATEFPSHDYQYFVQGNLLVVRDGSQLPDRCVITNDPTGPDERVTQQLLRAPSFSFVLSHQTFTITYSVGKRSRRRTKFIMLGVGALFLIAWIATGTFGAGLFVAFPIFLIQAFAKPRVFAVKKAQDGHYWVKGCSQAFLESLALEQPAQGAVLDDVFSVKTPFDVEAARTNL